VTPASQPSIHDATYQEMLRYILENGDGHADRTGTGTTSVFGYQNRYPLQAGFPLLTTKRMAWKSIVVELAWFLLGRTDNKWLTDRGVTIWNEWATKEQCAKFGRKPGDLGPIYGRAWREFGSTHVTGDDGGFGYVDYGVDQISTLCHDLANNPNSRRMIVTGWNPAEATQVALPPCHTLWQCKVRTSPHPDEQVRYLDLQLYQRSADSFLGVPFNIASYALLTHLLAAAHHMLPGVFVHTFGDLHVYNNHKAQVAEQLERTGFPAPGVMLPTDLAGAGFNGILRWAKSVGEAALDPEVKFAGPQLSSFPVRLLRYQHHPSIKAEVAV
jgi:thymidylate synthase